MEHKKGKEKEKKTFEAKKIEIVQKLFRNCSSEHKIVLKVYPLPPHLVLPDQIPRSISCHFVYT